MASLFASLPLLSCVRSESGGARVRVRVSSTHLWPESLIFRREAPLFPSARQRLRSFFKDRDRNLLKKLPDDFGIGDDGLPDICVTETNCTTSLFWKENICPKPKPKPKPEPEPNLIVKFRDTRDGRTFFVAFSSKDDGTISPKYYLYLPSILEKDYHFTWCICNGLLHFSDSELGTLSDGKLGHALWNPATNEYKILPKTFVEPHLEYFAETCEMVFDHRSQDYKLLQFVNPGGQGYQIHLYSLKTNSWKRIPLPSSDEFEFKYIIGGRASTCINGVCYCIAYPKVPPWFNVILAFDFTTETFSTLPAPESCLEALLDYKGLLCTYKLWEDEDAHSVPSIRDYEFWIMRDGSWTRESIFHTYGIVELFQLSQDGNLVYFSSIMDKEIVVFNRTTRKLKSLGVYCPSYVAMFPFVESFVQLNEVACIDLLDQKHTWIDNVSLLEREL